MIGTSEKRAPEAGEFDQKIKILIVDIEGTTTSISFVKDTLFPYIRENLQVYLKKNWEEPEFVEDLSLLRKQAESDKENGVEGLVPIPAGNNDDEICQAVLKNILWQMDLDRKTKALKQLQGHVMREGYENGKLKGHVYDDVQPALKSWTHSGRQVYAYSSGSVAAQKLLFGFSEKGDLLEFFSGHFDTEIGSKVESSSYSEIAKQLNCESEEIMFLTDIPKEAVAAREAGLHAVLVARPGNAPLSDDDCNKFRVIKSFDDIVFEVSAKRTKLSVEEPASSDTVTKEPAKNSNSDMQMEVDDNESGSKVSEGTSESREEKSNNKSEEVKALQNGSIQEQKEETILEISKEKDSKGAQDSESENVKSSCDLVNESTETSDKVESTSKTEKSKDNEKVIEMDTGKNESNVAESLRDNKTAENKNMDSLGEKTDNKVQEEQKVTPEETKTVEIPENEKTDELSTQQKTTTKDGSTSSVGESKTAEIEKSETEPTANEEKTAESIGESKTVDSISEDKNIQSIKTEGKTDSSEKSNATLEETTSETPVKSVNLDDDKGKTIAKDAQAPDTVKEVPSVINEAKSPEITQKIKITDVVDEKTKESTEGQEESKKLEEAKTVEVNERVEVPKTTEEVKFPSTTGETKAPELSEKSENSVTSEESKHTEELNKVQAPEILKEKSGSQDASQSEVSKTAEETKTSEGKETKSETTLEVKVSESVEKADSQTTTEKHCVQEEGKVSEPTKGDETMECEEIPNSSEGVENVNKSAEKTDGSEGNDKVINVDGISKKTENDEKELKKMEENQTVDSSGGEMVLDNCEKETSVEEKKIDEDMKEKVVAEDEKNMNEKNGETDIDMKNNASDSECLNAVQKAENDVTEKKVPMNVEDDDIKTVDTHANNDEAMETDAKDSQSNDVDTPMDIDSSKSAETASGNEKEKTEDSKNDVKEKENLGVMDSKSNGVNDSHDTPLVVNCEKKETDSKVIDNENIKLKKTTEESDTAKLNSSPSAQS